MEKNKKMLMLNITLIVCSIIIMGYSISTTISTTQKLNELELQSARDFEAVRNWFETPQFDMSSLDEPYTSVHTMSFLKRMFLPENKNTTVTITYDGSCYPINHTEYRDGEILMYSNIFIEYIDGDFQFSYGKP